MAINTGLTEIIKNHHALTHLTFKKGEMLFSAGEHAKGLYCIDKGSVKLYRGEPDNQRILHLAATGEILGLHSVVNNHPYINSASAITGVKACFIEAGEFLSMVESNNTYKLLVMKSLCLRIDTMEEQIISVAENSAEKRLAGTLLLLFEKYGVNKAKVLNITLTIEEIASFSYTSKSYMKKIISEFIRKELILFNEGKISILNIEQIKNLALQSKEPAATAN
jgi:CRP/FNR family transcriptional regulator, polysaccharide utilization system transcription regulator